MQKHYSIDLPKPIEKKIALTKSNNIVFSITTPLSADRGFLPSYRLGKSAKTKNTVFSKSKNNYSGKKTIHKKSVVRKTEDDKLAKISLILGIGSIASVFLVGGLTVFVGVAAIITGILSYKNTSKRGMSILGIVLGSLSVVIILVAVILFINLIILLFRGY
ncbi:MAG: DUF4190 domain-containing protein [Emticicia sp.]|nr:DUF4190 domain-containing protein [Emticicia sp.]